MICLTNYMAPHILRSWIYEPDITKYKSILLIFLMPFFAMPFGLCNAPSTFQTIMNNIFQLQHRNFILVFFNDILICSVTWDKHVEHVAQTL